MWRGCATRPPRGGGALRSRPAWASARLIETAGEIDGLIRAAAVIRVIRVGELTHDV